QTAGGAIRLRTGSDGAPGPIPQARRRPPAHLRSRYLLRRQNLRRGQEDRLAGRPQGTVVHPALQPVAGL
ncbi:uncharacterized protein METZ01_LOCUS220186, partial [marine metagenome]